METFEKGPSRYVVYSAQSLEPVAIVALSENERAVLSLGGQIDVYVPGHCPEPGWIEDGPETGPNRAITVSAESQLRCCNGLSTLLLFTKEA